MVSRGLVRVRMASSVQPARARRRTLVDRPVGTFGLHSDSLDHTKEPAVRSEKGRKAPCKCLAAHETAAGIHQAVADAPCVGALRDSLRSREPVRKLASILDWQSRQNLRSGHATRPLRPLKSEGAGSSPAISTSVIGRFSCEFAGESAFSWPSTRSPGRRPPVVRTSGSNSSRDETSDSGARNGAGRGSGAVAGGPAIGRSGSTSSAPSTSSRLSSV